MWIDDDKIREVLRGNAPDSLLFDGGDYDIGRLEAQERTIRQLRKFNFLLIGILIKTRILSLDEAVDLVSSSQI